MVQVRTRTRQLPPVLIEWLDKEFKDRKDAAAILSLGDISINAFYRCMRGEDCTEEEYQAIKTAVFIQQRNRVSEDTLEGAMEMALVYVHEECGVRLEAGALARLLARRTW